MTVPAAFKEVKEVVIGSFKVRFINHNKATEKPSSGFFSRNKESRVVLRSKLNGVSSKPVQAIASDEPFGELAEATSTLEKATGVFSLVNGALSGGNSTNRGE